MKRLTIFLIFALLFAGCSRVAEPMHRVVTGVQVEYTRHGDTLSRSYTKPANIQSVLTYLRLLEPFGPTLPEGVFDTSCKITLQYSHGEDSVYLQQGNHYLRKDGGDWQNINDSRASLLYPMLLLLPSDE